MLFSQDNKESTDSEDKINSWNQEQQEVKKNIQKIYGWYFLAHHISEYTKETYFQIMNRDVRECLSIVQIMKRQEQLNQK